MAWVRWTAFPIGRRPKSWRPGRRCENGELPISVSIATDDQQVSEPESTTFNARLPVHMKQVFQRAADLRHQTLSEFVLGSAYDRALLTINDDTVIRLATRDSEAFAAALDAPTAIDESVIARFRAASRNFNVTLSIRDEPSEMTIATFPPYMSWWIHSIFPVQLPSNIKKKLNLYDHWGALRLGRMARHDDYAGLGLGLILLARAFATALAIAEHTGSVALLVDAKNDALVSWYAEAFQSLPETPRTFFIVNGTVAAYLDAMAAPDSIT